MTNSANTLNQGQNQNPNQKQQGQKDQFPNQGKTGSKNDESTRKAGDTQKDEHRTGGN